ncbi:hypothetical protein GCM10023334_059370 [Nonomuraea thailandensis]
MNVQLGSLDASGKGGGGSSEYAGRGSLVKRKMRTVLAVETGSQPSPVAIPPSRVSRKYAHRNLGRVENAANIASLIPYTTSERITKAATRLTARSKTTLPILATTLLGKLATLCVAARRHIVTTVDESME